MKVCIYKLECRETGKFYIGSTTSTLNCRLKHHRSASKEPHRQNSPLYTHFREVGWDKARMITLCEIDVESRQEMLSIEKSEILKYMGSDLCLNHNRPIITRDEKKLSDAEYGKQRREIYADKERNRVAEWRRKNPEKYAEQLKRTCERQRERRLLKSSKVV